MGKFVGIIGGAACLLAGATAAYADGGTADEARSFFVDKAPQESRGKSIPIDARYPAGAAIYTDAEGAYTVALPTGWKWQPTTGNPKAIDFQGTPGGKPFYCRISRSDPMLSASSMAELQDMPEAEARASLEPVAVQVLRTNSFEAHTTMGMGSDGYSKRKPVRTLSWSAPASNGSHNTYAMVPTPAFTLEIYCNSALVSTNEYVIENVVRVAEGALVPRKTAASSLADIKRQIQAGIAAIKNKDYAQAMKVLKPLAEKGEHVSQGLIGLMYGEGLGVAQDYQEAARWYRKSAEQGNVIAQANLGKLYEYGRGVSQNYTEAVSWYRKSADAGGAAGRTGLGAAYFQGHGVEEDPVQAYKWLKLGIDGGDSDAGPLMLLALTSMTEEQIAKGEKLVEEWKASHK